MTTNAAPSGWGSTLERELKMTAMAHGTWNKRQVKLTSNNRENKVIAQGLRSFTKVIKNSRIQSITIRCNNCIAVFDIKKWRATSTLIKEIRKGYQIKEWFGILISITRLLGVKNEIADSLRRYSSLGDQKIKKKFLTNISSDELEPYNRCILASLQQATAKIHVINKRRWGNSNLRSQSSPEEGISMDSSSYHSHSINYEEDQRRTNRSNESNSIIFGPDMVYRTGKRECSIPYPWLGQQNYGSKDIINQEEFETPSKQDKLFPDEPKVRKGR
ncbi:MAG: hypothetical protein EZS28_035560 [Streblomastix strix]|uniref:Uncharacterized protein n=1 Tax=Streblomastix strix TaxID=222440 RepID=A0A5J4UFA1_9EUKA|nr:MAG: hypothetical protein EZS28_035560 [Streblomastix strix]